MKNILLLTDFSENARNAIRYALQLFSSEECTFQIMYVHKIGSYTSDNLMHSSDESIYDSITKEPKEKLNTLVSKLKEEFNNSKHSFETRIDFDVFIDAVNQTVKNKNIDFIVMGTNGASGAKEVIFGSNTINVIRKVDCKTIVIPEGHAFKPSKELLLSLGSKDTLKGNAFTELLEFIDTYQLHLHVLRLNPNKDSSEHGLEDESNLSIIDCTYSNIDGVPSDYAVSSYLQTNTVDFTALIVHHESFFERFFHGSSTTQISSTLKLPLLILHN